MRLSALQRYILIESFGARGRVGRRVFCKFYEGKSKKPKDAVDSITKTLERLIDKGLIIGYGVRTPKKWYIKEARLTPAGRKLAKKLRGEQQRLPFKILNPNF